jgi:hypothetical protein
LAKNYPETIAQPIDHLAAPPLGSSADWLISRLAAPPLESLWSFIYIIGVKNV